MLPFRSLRLHSPLQTAGTSNAGEAGSASIVRRPCTVHHTAAYNMCVHYTQSNGCSQECRLSVAQQRAKSTAARPAPIPALPRSRDTTYPAARCSASVPSAYGCDLRRRQALLPNAGSDRIGTQTAMRNGKESSQIARTTRSICNGTEFLSNYICNAICSTRDPRMKCMHPQRGPLPPLMACPSRMSHASKHHSDETTASS